MSQDDSPVAVIGVGSPLVDLLLQVDDAFLDKHVSGAKHGMELVDEHTIAKLIKASGKKPMQAPGGSAANITVGCAQLGMPSAFIGCGGADAYGSYYAEVLESQGCEPRIVDHLSLPTGHVLSMVTPDGERTMRTCLGAAATLDPDFFKPEVFAGARLVVMEGYSLYNHSLARAIAHAAKIAGCEVALDLASFEVVSVNRPVIEELLDGKVDVVLANHDEAIAWNSDGAEAALNDLAERCSVAAVKLGKEGAIIARGSERVKVSAEIVQAIDTTGAGDCWAAAFLTGYLRELPLQHCGQLGSHAGAAIVQQLGAQMPREKWLAIRGKLDAWT